ncbi:hypothetical protein P167DRAFT_497490 [Morchella conica CCBAS932]|uniref:Uncharacterized protein n=1 Tax=Morchella conica CCBAS932 TaxID=1392247 RepID=A0A3N4KDQ7_9PEZI|nr:hypothetical protein P167DRAFT_497490 [Morchella conica CCBAS932]
MVFRIGDCFWDTTIPISAGLISAPKGMKRVLQERGLWRIGLLKQCGTDECVQGRDCCCLRILEAQIDFKSEKSESLPELEITKRVHEVIFYPRFQCELYYMKFFWAAVKRYTRENCSYSFSKLEETIWEGLESVSLKTIRRFANRSRRWVQAYADGLTKEQKVFADKQYRSHRREYKSSLV